MWDLGALLYQLPLALVLFGLLLSELGLPVPETVFIVTAGVMGAAHDLSPVVPIAGATAAVFAGDLALFGLARYFGPPAFRHRPLSWFLPTRLLPRIDALFARHGAMAIFVARHLFGIRGPTFVLAGMRRMPIGRFLLWDALAVLINVPVFAGLGFFFGTRLDELELHTRQTEHVILGMLVTVLVGYLVLVSWRRRRERVS